MKYKTSLIFVTLLLTVSAFAGKNEDNTQINKRDRFSKELTAEEQSELPRDLAISSRIRKEILSKKGMSMNAQNIKVITIKGIVTIKGPVMSKDEENNIVKYASAIAGESNVVNQMSIVSK